MCTTGPFRVYRVDNENGTFSDSGLIFPLNGRAGDRAYLNGSLRMLCDPGDTILSGNYVASDLNAIVQRSSAYLGVESNNYRNGWDFWYGYSPYVMGHETDPSLSFSINCLDSEPYRPRPGD
jgi:hypothetical protein